jgi:dihydrofolate reductase
MLQLSGMTSETARRIAMAKLVLTFSMSLDGFVAGPDISVDQPMGKGGERLHDWMFKSQNSIDAEMMREQAARPGAVILGRRTFDLGLEPWGDTPYPVPCFVLTHEKREPLAMKSGTFTFVNDGIESALRQAKAAAGGKDVVVMGANTAQQYLKAGLVDEIALQFVPVIMDAGARLFENIDRHVELTVAKAVPSPHVTHLTLRMANGRQALPGKDQTCP